MSDDGWLPELVEDELDDVDEIDVADASMTLDERERMRALGWSLRDVAAGRVTVADIRAGRRNPNARKRR